MGKKLGLETRFCFSFLFFKFHEIQAKQKCPFNACLHNNNNNNNNNKRKSMV